MGIRQLIGTLSGAGFEVSEYFQHFQAIGFCFSHPDDTTAADGDACGLDGF